MKKRKTNTRRADTITFSKEQFSRFDKLVIEISQLLKETTVWPVIKDKLYISKDATWQARLGSSGHPIGVIDRHNMSELVREFAELETGELFVEESYLVEHKDKLFNKIIESLERALIELKKAA